MEKFKPKLQKNHIQISKKKTEQNRKKDMINPAYDWKLKFIFHHLTEEKKWGF